MFIAIPVILLIGCLVFAAANRINKRRFDTVIKALGDLRKDGTLSSLAPEEIIDLENRGGAPSDKLWNN